MEHQGGHTSSGIQHEHVYKRLEVRTVAVPDKKIKNDLENLLPKINPNRNFNVILISDIEHIEEKNEPCKRTSYNDKPDYITLGIIDTVNTSQHGYIPTETKENPHRALTSEATEKYSTDESFKNQVIEFLDFVSATTKNQVINLPESKHHGKLREKYIKEDKFLTTSKKEGSKDWGCRLLAEIGLTSKLDSTCTHGTNLYSFLIATKTSDGYLLPLNKQIKRFGLAQTGEQRKGYRPLNRKYISSIGLEFYQSSFKDAIKYSKYNSSSYISSSELFASQILTDNYPEPILKTYEALSKIPVVLIGYGASRGHTSSGIQHEHVYKRLEVRTVAVPDKKIKNDLENLLPKINPNRNFNVILISDIEHIEEKNEPCKRTSYNDKPDYITLGIIDPKD